MFVGENVDDLLDQLGGGDVVAVFGGSDKVVTHLLLITLLSGILGTV